MFVGYVVGLRFDLLWCFGPYLNSLFGLLVGVVLILFCLLFCVLLIRFVAVTWLLWCLMFVCGYLILTL